MKIRKALTLLVIAVPVAGCGEGILWPGDRVGYYGPGQNYPPPSPQDEAARLEGQRFEEAQIQKYNAEKQKREEEQRAAPPPHYDFVRPVAGRAILCRDWRATVMLSEPDARSRLGDINYVRAVTMGDCTEIGPRPVILCDKGPRLMWVRIGVFTRCGYVMAKDMVETGMPKGFRTWSDEKPYDER